MKPIYQKLTTAPEEGFAFKEIRGAGFDCPWHFHPEYELILVLQSRGWRMVGDNISQLEPGDMVLVGPNLPHIWQNERSAKGRHSQIHQLLIQFEDGFLGPLAALPAFAPVQRLLQQSTLGLQVTGSTRQRVAELMSQMAKVTGLRRVALFLTIFDELAHSNECRTLAKPGFSATTKMFDQERMNRVYQFIIQHLEEPIALPTLARLACLSEGAFSRFFRAHTAKTFPQFVNELRVGRACRLLAETDQNITEIAMVCGFANLSNFNRQFLRLKRSSPREFRQKMLQRFVEQKKTGRA